MLRSAAPPGDGPCLFVSNRSGVTAEPGGLRIGSLCSGIGGLERGLELAGLGHTVWQSEIDPHASQVLARHWPGVPNMGSVKEVVSRVPEQVDVICAGYP